MTTDQDKMYLKMLSFSASGITKGVTFPAWFEGTLFMHIQTAGVLKSPIINNKSQIGDSKQVQSWELYRCTSYL